jgi:hypothetical protein
MAKPAAAALLILASLVLGLIRYPLEFAPSFFLLWVAVPTLALIALLAWQIYAGKNWARIAYTVLFVLGLPFAILPLAEALQSRPISGVLGVLQLVMQSTAVVFLYLPGGRPWFHR